MSDSSPTPNSTPDETAQVTANCDSCPRCGIHLSWTVQGDWNAYRISQCSCGYIVAFDNANHPKYERRRQNAAAVRDAS